MSKKTVIVCGATGKQGKAVIDALKKDSSFDIRALVRNPDSPAAKALVEAGVTLVKGDFGDKNSLVRAFQGNWGVYIVTVPEPFNHAGCQKEIKVGKDAVDAAKEANVNFVVMSSVGRADKHTGIPHFESKGQIEDHLRASGLKHCILRPVAFMDNLSMPGMELKQGVYTGLTNPGVKLDYIAVDDIGEFAALAFKDPHKFEGKVRPCTVPHMYTLTIISMMYN